MGLGGAAECRGEVLGEEIGDEVFVRREPLDALQCFRGEPACGEVLFESECVVEKVAEVAVHGEMEVRVVVVDSGEVAVGDDVGVQLFL